MDIKRQRYTRDKYGQTTLSLNLKGDFSYVDCSSMRRCCYDYVSTIAFTVIKISHNTSDHKDDRIKSQIRGLPVPVSYNTRDNIEKHRRNEELNLNKAYMPSKETVMDKEEDIDLFETREGDEVDDNFNHIIMFFEAMNTKNEVMNVTTDDCTFYYRGKQISNFYNDYLQNQPHKIIELRKNQKVRVMAITRVCTGEVSAHWSPITICAWNEINDSYFENFKICSRWQLCEYEILYRSAMILVHRMNDLKSLLADKPDIIVEEDPKTGKIIIDGENHTIGNLLKYYMQNHKMIRSCGYRMPHPEIEQVIINYVTMDGGDIVKVVNESIGTIVKKFTTIATYMDKHVKDDYDMI